MVVMGINIFRFLKFIYILGFDSKDLCVHVHSSDHLPEMHAASAAIQEFVMVKDSNGILQPHWHDCPMRTIKRRSTIPTQCQEKRVKGRTLHQTAPGILVSMTARMSLDHPTSKALVCFFPFPRINTNKVSVAYSRRETVRSAESRSKANSCSVMK